MKSVRSVFIAIAEGCGSGRYYYVTPVTDDDLLREHNWVGLENTSCTKVTPATTCSFPLPIALLLLLLCRG